MCSDGWMMGSWGPLMMLLAALFWLLIIGGIVWLVVWLVERARIPQQAETPLDVLKKRYARGEIGKEEYERMKQDLA